MGIVTTNKRMREKIPKYFSVETIAKITTTDTRTPLTEVLTPSLNAITSNLSLFFLAL